jgi:hypothetical protein
VCPTTERCGLKIDEEKAKTPCRCPKHFNPYMPTRSAQTGHHTLRTVFGLGTLIPVRVERWRKKTRGRRRCRVAVAYDGDSAPARFITVGGEARTSPETRTKRMAAASPTKVRKKTLGFGSGVRVRRGFGNLGIMVLV